MGKYGKQRLFEMMQRVNPDFSIKEEAEVPEYTGDELELLNILLHNLMNAHFVRNPATEKLIYNYNKKYGNVIKFPLLRLTRDEVIDEIINFIQISGGNTPPELREMDNNQLIELLNQSYINWEKELEERLKSTRPDNSWNSVFDDFKQKRKYELKNIAQSLQKAEEFKGFPSSKDSLHSNFYEMFPVAKPTWDGRLENERAIAAMKSLENKGAVKVIPFTEQEKQEMNEILKSSYDYLTPNWEYTKYGYAHVIVILDDYNKINKLYTDNQKANFKFTKEYLNDLLSTSMEGGSNYWALFDHRFIAPQLLSNKSMPLSEKIINSVWDYHKSIPIYDVEGGEESDKEYGEFDNPYESYEKLGELSMDSILQAISLIKKDPQYEHIFENIATENYDAGDADAFFQLAIMGEVVYG